MSNAAADRYITSDFQNSPLLALADLMGRRSYQSQIFDSPDLHSKRLSTVPDGIYSIFAECKGSSCLPPENFKVNSPNVQIDLQKVSSEGPAKNTQGTGFKNTPGTDSNGSSTIYL